MPFWDLQRQLGIDMDRWLLRQSATQPYGVAGACHAFEREWVECGHGLGQTRARRECQPEYEDFMECMHRTKLVSPAGRPGTGRGGGGGGRGTAAREARAEPRGGAAILRLRSRRRPRPRWALGGAGCPRHLSGPFRPDRSAVLWLRVSVIPCVLRQAQRLKKILEQRDKMIKEGKYTPPEHHKGEKDSRP